MNQERAKEMTVSTDNQLHQNYTSLHTAQTTFPYSTVFYSLPPSIFTPSNSTQFQTQSCYPDFWVQQTLGHDLNWVQSEYTNFEDQSSLMNHKICEVNKKRPSVIQSTGRALPLDEAGTNIRLTNISSLPSKLLDGNHIIPDHKGSGTNTAVLNKEKQLSSKSLVHKVYENQNISGRQQVTSETWPTTFSELDTPRKKKYRFCCRFCNKPYHWRSHWKAHERIHTGERPFKCEICGKGFTRSDGLQCHRHTHLRKNGSTNSMSKKEYVQNNTATKGEEFNDGNGKPSEGVELKREGEGGGGGHFKNR